MRNSLDHAFNPLIGIVQMLSICKIGGRVILQHAKNEAENENYEGFHQWNLCVNNSQFMLWRPQIEINVTETLKEYADFMIKDTTDERFFTVVLTKNKDIPCDFEYEKLDKIRNELIFKKLSELIIKDAYKDLAGNSIIILKRAVKKIPFLSYLARKIYKK
jgi:hypothetical protein